MDDQNRTARAGHGDHGDREWTTSSLGGVSAGERRRIPARALAWVILAIYFVLPAGVAYAAGSAVPRSAVPRAAGCCCVIPIGLMGVTVAGGVAKRRRDSEETGGSAS